MIAVLEELINSLYETVQDAKNVPLSSDKCIIEREAVLDILDEIRANMPSDLRMAKEIVEKRSSYMEAGKKEVEELRAKAEDYVRKTVNESAVVAAANAKAQEIISNAEQQAAQIRGAAQQFCEMKLDAAETCAAQSLDEIRKCRQQFVNAGQATK
ncbi:MAG: hypothetical protein ACI4PM_00845 [Butyricicoccus sp.]